MKTFTLNNTTLCFHQHSGILCGIEYAGRQFVTGGGGPLDVALPTENLRYELMRVSPGGIGSAEPDFSLNGRVLTVRYPELGKLFDVPALPELEGGVEAVVTYTALPDGRSISMQCRVENHCDTPVRQVVFPDFVGLDPVDSREATRLTTLGLVDHPFIELADTPETRMNFFAQQPSVAGKIYHGGGYFGGSDNMIGRYYDYGSLAGGFSVFCKWWGWGPDNMQAMGLGEQLLARLNQETGRLRLGSLHYVTVGKGRAIRRPNIFSHPTRAAGSTALVRIRPLSMLTKSGLTKCPSILKRMSAFVPCGLRSSIRPTPIRFLTFTMICRPSDRICSSTACTS